MENYKIIYHDLKESIFNLNSILNNVLQRGESLDSISIKSHQLFEETFKFLDNPQQNNNNKSFFFKPFCCHHFYSDYVEQFLIIVSALFFKVFYFLKFIYFDYIIGHPIEKLI